MMMKSCGICGKLHKHNEMCPARSTARIKKESMANKFRKTYKWTQKSIEIRNRDDYMCQLCLRLFEGTLKQYNIDNIQAHHIESIEDHDELKLENLNLVSVCKVHHDMAEAGYISRSELKMIAKEQEDKLLKEVPPIV